MRGTPTETGMRPDSTVQPLPISPPAPDTVEIVGVPLALTDYDQTLDWVDAMI